MQHLGIKETGLLSSCSDYHIFLKLKKNWKSAAEEYLAMAKMAAERDIRVRFHIAPRRKGPDHGAYTVDAVGRGSAVMVPMAIPSFGGMLVVLISIFVVPVLYSAIEELKLKFRTQGTVNA